jgi:hypothetical protein
MGFISNLRFTPNETGFVMSGVHGTSSNWIIYIYTQYMYVCACVCKRERDMQIDWGNYGN